MSAWINPEKPRLNSSWARAACICAVAVPPLAVAAFQMRFAITVPYMDSWELVPYIERAQNGTLRIAELFDQHNAHRIAMSRALMVGLALLTGWDLRYEIAVNFACGLGVFFLWCLLLLRHSMFRARELFIVSLATFSIAAWRNWIWGWQMALMLCLVCAVASIAALDCERLGRFRHPLAILAAMASTYSFAGGLAVWPAAAVFLWLRRSKAWEFALWASSMLATVVLYLVGFHLPSDATDVDNAHVVFSIAGYVFAYLGGGLLTGTPAVAVIAGMLGATLFVYLLATMPRDDRVERASLIALATFSALTGIIASAGRANEGIAQAVASRYTSFSLVFWIVVALLLLDRKGGMRRRLCAYSIALLIALQSAYGAYQGSQRAVYYNAARPALIAGEPIEDFTRLFPDTETLLTRRAYLRDHRLSVFRLTEPSPID